VLSEASSTLTLGWMFPELLEQAPKSQWHFYEPVRGSRSGWTAYSDCDFSLLAARTIVCLDADILDLYPGAVRYAREHLMALPKDLQATAFDILTASLQREFGLPTRNAAHPSGAYPSGFIARGRRRYRRT